MAGSGGEDFITRAGPLEQNRCVTELLRSAAHLFFIMPAAEKSLPEALQ